MVSHDEIEKVLKQDSRVHYAHVLGDGYHYELTIVADVFEGMRKLQRQQWVYGKLNQYITSGELHALSMKTYTQAEWEAVSE